MTRIVNFGLLGTVWTVLTADEVTLNLEYTLFGRIDAIEAFKAALLAVVVSLFVDFLQYFSGYLRDLRVRAEIGSGHHYRVGVWNPCSFWYIAARVAFRVKLILTALNTIWVAFLLALCHRSLLWLWRGTDWRDDRGVRRNGQGGDVGAAELRCHGHARRRSRVCDRAESVDAP